MATTISGITNVSADINSLYSDTKTALSSLNSSSWTAVINDLTALVADAGSMAKNSPAWANALGGAVGYSVAQAQWQNILNQYQSGGISNVNVANLLSMISGESNAIATAAIAVTATTGIPAPAALGVAAGALGAITGAAASVLNANPQLSSLTLGQLAGNLAAGFDSSGDAIINSINGTSAVVYNSGLPAGYQSAVQYFSGWNGTGALSKTVITTTAGWSQVQINNPSAGVTYQASNFQGPNGTGPMTWQLQNLSNNTSTETNFTSLAAGLSSVTQTFSGLNGSGTNTSNILNTQAGWSQVQLLANLASGVTYEAQNHASLNGTGAVTWDLKNLSNNTSVETSYTGLAAGVSSLVQTFSGTNGTGTLVSNLLNTPSGTSQLQQFANLPSGVSEIISNFPSLNGAGTASSITTDYSNGTSKIVSNTNLPSGVTQATQTFSGLNGAGSLVSTLLNTSAGGSQLQQFTGLASGVVELITNYPLPNGGGAASWQMENLSNGQSAAIFTAGLPAGASRVTQNYSAANGGGLMTSQVIQETSGNVATINFNYNSSNVETSFSETLTNSSGGLLGSGTFTPSGVEQAGGDLGGSCSNPVVSAPVSSGGGGDDSYVEVFSVDCGGYGFAGNQSNINQQLGSNISALAQYDSANGNSAEAAIVQSAFAEVKGAIASSASGNAKEVATGATWGGANAITWETNSTINTPAELAALEGAFAAWAAASGLKFEEVANGAVADINLGFSDLDTAVTGVVGFTTNQTNGSQMVSSTIQLEGPNQDALSSDGTLTYAGTQATLEQDALHEIGHSLGLADNANDPTSIEYYYLGASNRTLNSADMAAVQALYSTNGSGGASGLQSANQLISAMSQTSSSGGATQSVPNALLFNNTAPIALGASH